MLYPTSLIFDYSSFSHVFWIDASSDVAITQGLKGICNLPAAQTQSLNGSLESVLSWIGSLRDNYAMVFDNADALTPEELESYFPPGIGGNILITSRNSAMQRLTSPENSYEVEEMEEDDAILLLLKAACLDTSRSELKAEASEIVKELVYMPLAIDQAGAYIVAGAINIRDYLSKYHQHRESLLNHSEFKGASKYNRTVYGTWEMSYQEIQRRAESDDLDKVKAAQSAMLILGLFAFFHYDGIMKDIFSYAAMHKHCHHIIGTPALPIVSSMLDCTLLPINEAGNWDDFIFQEGIRVLLSFCLIRLGSSDGIYTVHPLIHAWGKDRMSLDERKKYGTMAYATLSDSLYGNFERQPYEFRRALVMHVRRIESQGPSDSYFDDAYERFGNLLLDQGYPGEALKLQQQVLDLRNNVLGKEHYYTVIAAVNLARTYNGLGRYTDAEQLYVHVLHVSKRRFGEEHQNTIHAMGNLSVTYTYLGKYIEAERLQIAVLNLCIRTLGEDHVDSITAMARLASTLTELGKYSEALKLKIQVLEARNRILGPEHPRTISAMSNVAVTYKKLGEYSEAEKLLIQAVDLNIRIRGAEHPTTTIYMSNLASAYSHLGKHTEAEELKKQVLDTSKQILGEEHPDTLINMGNLAVTYNILGKYEEAEKLESQVLDIKTRTLGAEHPNTVHAMANLADSFRDLKKYSEAEKLQIQVLDLRKRIFGEEHPDTKHAMVSLAITQRVMGHNIGEEDSDELTSQCPFHIPRTQPVENSDKLTSQSPSDIQTIQPAENSDNLTSQSPFDIQSTQPPENPADSNRRKKKIPPSWLRKMKAFFKVRYIHILLHLPSKFNSLFSINPLSYGNRIFA